MTARASDPDGITATVAAAIAVDRPALPIAAMALCAVNGLAGRALDAVARQGWAAAALDAFGISAIVWVAVGCGLVLAATQRADRRPAHRIDPAIATPAILLSLVPSANAGWAGATLAAIAILATTPAGEPARRGAAIVLAASVTMLWTRFAFAFGAEQILAADAFMTAKLLGTSSSGNLVGFADGSGFFQIYPACSSLGNTSLALLGWIAVANLVGLRSRRRAIAWGGAIAAAVVTINVARLVAIGLWPSRFDLIHGDVGNTVIGWTTLAVVGLVCTIGVRPAAANA